MWIRQFSCMMTMMKWKQYVCCPFPYGFFIIYPQVVSEHVEQLNASEDFSRTVHNFDSNFSTLLIELLDKLSLFSTANCEHNMMNIIHRLDFNGFYTAQLEQCTAERSRMEAGQGEMGEGGASMMWSDIDIPVFFQEVLHIWIMKSIHLPITSTWNMLI